jgi:hypothetical protein
VVAIKCHWLRGKSLVNKVVYWLLWKASGRYGEVRAAAERQRSLGEVSDCCGKSLVVKDSQWVLKKSMLTMGSHCMLFETLVAVGSRWLQR